MVSQWCHYPHWKYLLRFHFLIAVSHYLAFVSISVIQTTKWFSCFLWDRRCSSSGEILFIKEQRQIRGFVKVNLSIAIVGAVSQPFSPVKMIQPKICQTDPTLAGTVDPTHGETRATAMSAYWPESVDPTHGKTGATATDTYWPESGEGWTWQTFHKRNKIFQV